MFNYKPAEEALVELEKLSSSLKSDSSPQDIYTHIVEVLRLLKTPHICTEKNDYYINHVCQSIAAHASELKKFETLDERHDQKAVYDFSCPIACVAVEIPSLKVIKTLYKNGFDLSFDHDCALYTLILSRDNNCDEKIATVQYMLDRGCGLTTYLKEICREKFDDDE